MLLCSKVWYRIDLEPLHEVLNVHSDVSRWLREARGGGLEGWERSIRFEVIGLLLAFCKFTVLVRMIVCWMLMTMCLGLMGRATKM
jgi:hypothetical protein